MSPVHGNHRSLLASGFCLLCLCSGVAGGEPPRPALKPIPQRQVRLLSGIFRTRSELNREYLMSLRNEGLLQNFYLEAGLWNPNLKPSEDPGAVQEIHWGWEAPTCQLRGHFLGHWLSAAAHQFASTGDAELKAKADRVVAELARCQEANGGEWAGSIPEKYLNWIAGGRRVWAPHYTIHKTFMGLNDMSTLAGNRVALEVAEKFAGWFSRWTADFDRPQMDDILDVETGGMLEAWADLYAVTSKAEYRELIRRYDRPRLFNRLLAGEDPLTNRHANTTIPEAHGAARAFEVTGEERWRQIVEAYWKSAVTDRGYFCTGGQTTGEIWNPPMRLSARLSESTQEHCTVYNMIRLADYLFRWTGDVGLADYIERNLYNGILAQQNPDSGMVAYFLPLHAGARKIWSTPTQDFWCCVGTLVQAHTLHNRHIYYESPEGLTVAQYIPSELEWRKDGTLVRVQMSIDEQTQGYRSLEQDDPIQRPRAWALDVSVDCEKPLDFELALRLPWWLAAEASLTINGQPAEVAAGPSSFERIKRRWSHDKLRLLLPMKIVAVPLPDDPDTVAFMEGPVVLAGLTAEERRLEVEGSEPAALLRPEAEREWAKWLVKYRANGQERGLHFKPLYEVVDEQYTVYFPISRRK